MRTSTGARRSFPYFRLAPGEEVVRVGTFEQGRPWLQTAYDLLSYSQTLTYFNVDFPIFVSDTDLDLVAALLAKSRDYYRGQFGNDRFYVLLYPQSTLLKRLRPFLDRRNVRFLDYTDLFIGETRPVVIPHDGHPTPVAFRLIGERLVEDLGIGSPAGTVATSTPSSPASRRTR